MLADEGLKFGLGTLSPEKARFLNGTWMEYLTEFAHVSEDVK